MNDFKKKLTEVFPKLEIHARTAAKKYSMEYSDLMQETVIRGLEKQHLFDGKNIEAWLKTIMTNLAIDNHRKETIKSEEEDGRALRENWSDKSNWKPTKAKDRKVNIDTGDKDENDEETTHYLSDQKQDSGDAINFSSSLDQKRMDTEFENDEEIKQLYKFMTKLGEKCQELFRRYMEVEGSFKEVSERMGEPLGTVQSRFHRCKLSLLKIIQND